MFKKHGYLAEARALEYVLVGFFRDPTDDMPDHEAIRKRCAKRCRATRFHSTYECADNQAIWGGDLSKIREGNPRSKGRTQKVPVSMATRHDPKSAVKAKRANFHLRGQTLDYGEF